MPESLVPVASEGAVKFLAALLGDPVKEASAILADEIRFRRWKNQLTILDRAHDILKQRGIAPKSVSLKVLVPLVESASLEDEPSLQDMWARLLAKASSDTAEKTFFFVCTEILKSISKDEAALLTWMFSRWKERERTHIHAQKAHPDKKIRELEDDSVMFGVGEVFKVSGLPPKPARVILDNLMRLNLVRYEIPDVGFSDYNDAKIDVSFPNSVHLTHLAIRMMETCSDDRG